MPDQREHESAYARHLASYADTREGHPDWAAVMLFYCAVHQVERLLATEGSHSCEHADREYMIKSRYNSLWKDYRALKSESLKTRYLQGGSFSLSSAQVERKLRAERLAAIVQDIDARISARQILPPSAP